jgi:hypothetical protein
MVKVKACMASDDWSKPFPFMPKGIPKGEPKALPHFTLAQVKITASADRVEKVVNYLMPLDERATPSN